MAVIFIDGFDKYGKANQFSPAANFLQGEYTNINANNGSISVAAGLGPTGQSMQFNQGSPTSPFISKNFAVTAARIIGGFRFNTNLSVSTSFFETTKGGTGTPVWALTLPTTGIWSLRTGGTGGAVLGSAPAISANTTHYLEFDITIGASNSYQIWIDGASVISGTGNTGNGQTLVDGIAFGIATGGGGLTTIQFDDLYIFDGTGTTNNAPLLSNPCVETTLPSSDVQTQWTNQTSVVGNYSLTVNASNAPGANQLYLRKVTVPVNVTLNSVGGIPQATSGTAKFKAVVYPDSGGSPNGQALIAAGTEVVGTTNGVRLNCPFASPPSLTTGTYWIGFITDTSLVMFEADSTLTGVRAANTYASGAPGTCPTVTTGQNSWCIWGNCSASAVNWVSEIQNPPIGDISSIISSTVGNEDLYGFAALLNTPTAIYTVAVKASMRVAGAGARTIDLRTKSVNADSAGSNPGQSLATSYNWADSYFDTDPDGGGAWTGIKLNAASSGIKVAS